jgi:hypothetical protein
MPIVSVGGVAASEYKSSITILPFSLKLANEHEPLAA